MLLKSRLKGVFVALLIVIVSACGGKKEGDVKAKTATSAKDEDKTKEFLTEDIVKR